MKKPQHLKNFELKSIESSKSLKFHSHRMLLKSAFQNTKSLKLFLYLVILLLLSLISIILKDDSRSLDFLHIYCWNNFPL